MTGEGPDGQGMDSTRQRVQNAVARSPRVQLRQRTSSFSTACSQSTISTKPANQSGISPAPLPTSTVQDTAKRVVSPAQSTMSTKPSMSLRQKKLLTIMRRTRSSGEGSRKSTQRQQEDKSVTNTERMIPRAGSVSSGPKPPKPLTSSLKTNLYGSSGIVSRHSAGIPRVSTPSSRASPSHHSQDEASRRRRQVRQQHVPRSPSTTSRVDSNVVRQGSMSERTTFHVRLSIGYMTGLKMEKISKWTRQPSNRRIIVGFVELASSGKYTALSQPLLSNIGDSQTRIAKIVWANPRGGKDASKLRRRLHFSLQLERELPLDAREDRRDDDSFTSLGSYSPEVVKLLVGLKCGDEKLNLGTAKLVINGRETVEQKMDLTVQPAPMTTSGFKAKRGLFGKKQLKNCFTNGDHSFKVTPNATLRVKADIRTGHAGQDGASVWGKDDSSYTTQWTYDTSTAYPLSPNNGSFSGTPADPSSFGMIPSYSTGNGLVEERRTVMGTTNGRDSSLFGESPTAMQFDPSASLQPRLIHTVPPVPVVSLRKKEDKSYMSGLTGPDVGCTDNWWSKACTSLLCGELEDPKKGCRGLVCKSFSFDTLSQRLSDDIQVSSDSTSTDDSSTEAGEDLKGTLIHIRNDTEIPSQKTQQQGSKKIAKTRQQDTSEEHVETLDVTAETYNDLKDAQETLMRYANKVGKNMDDLFDEMEHSQKPSKKRSQTNRRSLKL